ncbi:MAG: hypothetical protein LBR22_03010 [Desulfovibrio sp.]|jgi:hypothetical protein|nr:hypothetical protein [Desulfovibrio sp.]
MLKRIPHDNSISGGDDKEVSPLYRKLIIGFLYGTELFVMSDMHSKSKNSGIVFECGKKPYIVELKTAVGENNALKELVKAMKQIDKESYTGVFPNPMAIGLIVDEEERLITHMCIETEVYHLKKRKLTHLGKLNELAAAASRKGSRTTARPGTP